jgi:Ca2+-binding RTX toxin-like protein
MARIFFDGFSTSRIYFDGYASLESEGLLPSFGLKSSISQFDTADACAGCGLKHTDGSEDGCGGGHSHVDGDTNWADWLIGTDVDPSTIASTIAGDVTTTAELVVGTQTTSAIDFAGDRDWFRVELTDGQTYQIIAAGTGPFVSALDTTIRLYNADGALITLDSDGGVFDAAQLTFTAFGDQTFFVEVDASGSATGSYTLDAEVFDRGVDAIANGISANPVIVVDGADGTGRIDYNTDEDWFAVELVAGQNYLFELNGTGVQSLNDAYLTIHAEDGAIITFNDDGGSGLNSRLVYQATSTGTYYLAAQGFTGNSVDAFGDFTLSASTTTETSSLLDALDWGTQLNTTVVDVYFAGIGESFDGNTSNGWTQAEIDAVMDALGVYENYIDLEFRQTNNSTNAEFVLVVDSSDEYLGFFGPPNTGTGTGIGVFSDEGTGWSTAGLVQGGFGYVTVIHEIGHGLGLAHPHDGGGASGVLNGVFDSASTGQFDLNQGVYTTMSYVDGWDLAPYGTSGTVRYGWQGTPMALDVAVLQGKYGANTTHNNGNDTYIIQTANAAGTFWQSIWDTGGIDTISYAGDADARIDLREATLQYEEGGGGFLSYADGLFGGFTVANGVDVENITSGGGDDFLIGNALVNVISAGAGNDLIVGGGGGDTLDGGAGIDTVSYAESGAAVRVDLSDDTTSGGDAQGDVISNFENVIGSAFDDVLVSGVGANALTGGAGNDTASYAASAVAVNVNLQLEAASGGSAAGDVLVEIENLIGSRIGDVLTGNELGNVLSGEGGNDALRGLDGDDVLDGGDGNDRLQGDDGADTLLGGSGNDTAFGGNGNDILNGGSGIDRLTGNDGDDVFDGGADNDRIIGGSGVDTGTGGDGVDNLSGGDDDDILYGGAGNDRVQGDNGNDTLYGEDGDDRIVGGLGDDIMFGGIGNDLLIGQNGDDDFDGGDGDDIMQGGAGVNTFNAGAGNDRAVGGLEVDTMLGGAGNDLLIGNGGNDIIDGEDGDDRLEGDNGNDLLNGGLGNDLIYGGAGVDTINGGEGVDTILGGGGSDLINGDAGNDILRGEDGNDTINGGDGDDDIRGQVGFDTLNGGDGDDRIQGDDGNDTIDGGAGADTIFGGNGNDSITGGAGADILRGNSGEDTIDGGADNDVIAGDAGDDFILAGTGDDIVNGGADDDLLFGDGGADTLNGDDGFDFLDGGAGDDILNGGSLGDVLIGGAGADTLTGGSGADVFVFNAGDSLVGGEDIIMDFEVGDILATSSHTFRGTDGFSATGVFEVRYVSDAMQTYFEFDRNGDGVVDERIDLDTNSVWTFASQGEEISGVISGPAELDLIG